jgi:hypothetical protein
MPKILYLYYGQVRAETETSLPYQNAAMLQGQYIYNGVSGLT